MIKDRWFLRWNNGELEIFQVAFEDEHIVSAKSKHSIVPTFSKSNDEIIFIGTYNQCDKLQDALQDKLNEISAKYSFKAYCDKSKLLKETKKKKAGKETK